MNLKILSPVGDFESLKMAVFNGADEIYLGITDFNARNTNGFSLEQLPKVVHFSHLYNVKVLLAVNILFKNSELNRAVDLVVDAYNMGVDAFIVQDLGLISLLHANYPELELHASTQMGIHNLEGVKFLEKYGITRVVLARETPLDEIKRIRQNSDVEIEYFAHGALCVSFSGNCYLSSKFCNASGNRGKCKQLCRLPYTLKNENKTLAKGYLLSAKDFNMINRLSDLENAGVNVIKIEGRARRPYYVATATKEYYNAIHGEKVDNTTLQLAFNRGFTEGYFNGNGNIISKYNNHIGIKVGKVVKVNNGKKFNEVFLETSYPINKKSAFKVFVDGVEKSSFTAFDLQEVGKNKYKVTTTNNVPLGDLHLIMDNALEEQALSKIRKIAVYVNLTAVGGENITAIVKCRNVEFKLSGETCDIAKNNPLTNEELNTCFNKSETFLPNITCTTYNAFLPKQKLNEFRRNVYAVLEEKLTANIRKQLEKKNLNTNLPFKALNDFSVVLSQNDKFLTKNIIYSPETYTIDDIIKFKEKCDKLNKVGYLDLPNFALYDDIKLLREIIEKTKIGIVANNYYALSFDTDIIIGAGLNVYNSVSAHEFGLFVVTAESDIASKINFPYMALRHCPFKCDLGATCAKCPYNKNYTLTMQDGTVLHLSRKKLSTCTFYLS